MNMNIAKKNEQRNGSIKSRLSDWDMISHEDAESRGLSPERFSVGSLSSFNTSDSEGVIIFPGAQSDNEQTSIREISDLDLRSFLKNENNQEFYPQEEDYMSGFLNKIGITSKTAIGLGIGTLFLLNKTPIAKKSFLAALVLACSASFMNYIVSEKDRNKRNKF